MNGFKLCLINTKMVTILKNHPYGKKIFRKTVNIKCKKYSVKARSYLYFKKGKLNKKQYQHEAFKKKTKALMWNRK